MKLFNITAQVYKNNDPSKQTMLFNQEFDGLSPENAIENFKLHFPSIDYSLVRIYSAEEILQVCS
jgi:hypothetical protein